MRLRNPVKIAEGVYQLRAVGARVTAVTAGDGIVLGDAGGRGSVRSIAAGLKALGSSLDRVRLAVLTHYHPDHFGYKQGMPVYSTLHTPGAYSAVRA